MLEAAGRRRLISLLPSPSFLPALSPGPSEHPAALSLPVCSVMRMLNELRMLNRCLHKRRLLHLTSHTYSHHVGETGLAGVRKLPRDTKRWRKLLAYPVTMMAITGRETLLPRRVGTWRTACDGIASRAGAAGPPSPLPGSHPREPGTLQGLQTDPAARRH